MCMGQKQLLQNSFLGLGKPLTELCFPVILRPMTAGQNPPLLFPYCNETCTQYPLTRPIVVAVVVVVVKDSMMVEEVVKDNMVVEEDAGDKSGGTENKMTDWVEYVGTVGKHKSRGTNIDMNYIGHN